MRLKTTVTFLLFSLLAFATLALRAATVPRLPGLKRQCRQASTHELTKIGTSVILQGNLLSDHGDNVPPNAPSYKRIMRDTLIITQGTLWSDGNPRPDSVLINGTSPGPLLRYRAGDWVLIKVINQMQNQNFTMHFHGLSASLTPSSDGTPMVSQWPIAPGNFFEYELHLTSSDVGTTFYHSHIGVQAMTAHAPFIVEEAQDQLDALVPIGTQEKVLVLGDYYYANDSAILNDLRSSPFVWPGSAKSVLLNGRAWKAPDACNDTVALHANIDCLSCTYDGPAVIDVEYETTYRMRYIGAMTLMHLAVSIFNHTQTLIAADGTFLEHVDVEYVELMSGQRYDTLLVTKTYEQVAQDTANSGCYLIRMETRWRVPQANGWALLRYPGAQCSVLNMSTYPLNNTQTYMAKEQFGWISDQLHPHRTLNARDPVPTDDEVTRRIYLYAQQVNTSPFLGNRSGIAWDVNALEYVEDAMMLQNSISMDEPYLIAVYKNKTMAPSYSRAIHPSLPNVQSGYDTSSQTYVARAGEVIDIVIINNSSAVNNVTETHPWHFHSQDHWTMAMGIGDFTEEKFAIAKAQFSPPIARDTTGLWPGLGASVAQPPELLAANTSGAWSVLRYRVPLDGRATGVWMLHCHWAFHQAMGMATIWSFVPQNGNTPFSLAQYIDPAYLEYGHNVSAPFTLSQGMDSSGVSDWDSLC